MIIDTLHVYKTQLLIKFLETMDCNLWFKLPVKDDSSQINTPYLKQLYKTYKYVQSHEDELCKTLFRSKLDNKVSESIIGRLFNLPVVYKGKEKWSFGFTCPNTTPWIKPATKWTIVVSIDPRLKKFGGPYANLVYLMHEYGHVYQHLWYGRNLEFIKSLNVSQFKKLRNLTHAIIQWLVDIRFGKNYSVTDKGHKFLLNDMRETKSVYKEFLRDRTMTIYDCFDRCKEMIERSLGQ